MEETERNLREKIEQEAKNTLKKTMWEGNLFHIAQLV